MKFVAVVCVVVFALLGVAFGLKDPVCGLQPDRPGNCLALMTMYSFHSDSNSCKSFYYGGCGGNDNRFDTLGECEAKCKE